MNLKDWLESNGLGKYAELFAENEIDLDLLPQLTEGDLNKLGLSVGARRRLAIAIGLLDTSEQQQSVANVAGVASAERRQLTVLFCDLVGSTALSQRLDPEALRALIGGYQKKCSAVIAKLDGYVAQYLGDGVMIYFGWPRAHEDDAERAVRAALEMVDTVTKSGGAEPLHVRIGIATGTVVVGESSEGDRAEPGLAVGETPNLAARLQGLAGVDEIVISPVTRRLAGASVVVEDMGDQTLKGITEPVRSWRVTGLGRSRARFDASSNAGKAMPLVGRETELALLLDRWDQAREGEGQVVLLSGEPGIGKSRLTQALREKVGDKPHIRIRYQCSPYHSSTALHPFIEQLQHAARFATDDTTDIKLAKLESMLSQAVDDPARAVPFVASLLSVDYTSKYAPLTVTPQKQKDLMLQALGAQLTGLSGKTPVLMILEDAHWIDPTSQGLFNLMVPMVSERSVLLVVTFRPEYQSQWQGFGHVTPLQLSRLPRRHAAAMIETVSAGTALKKEVIDEIAAKTDGVPLYVEEVTKAVMESSVQTVDGSGHALRGAAGDLIVPSTLQASLMARLDRLNSAKDIAQIGACIGREFNVDLLAAVSKRSEENLTAAVHQLIEAELVYEKETLNKVTYVFKHALVQEAAYSSLLRSRRERIHADIAEAIVRLFPDLAEARPEVLAHHFSHAARADEAIAQWLIAGRRAVQQASNVEAIAHLEKALDALRNLPETKARQEQELAVRIVLGPAVLAVKGWSSPEVHKIYERARVLCEQFAGTPEAFAAVWGIWVYQMTSGGSTGSMESIDELLRLSAGDENPEHELQAHHAAWTAKIWNGQLDAGLKHAEAGLQIYDIDAHRGHAMRFGGHDPAVCGWGQAALAKWLTGNADQAFESARKGIELGRQLNHAPSLGHGLVWASFVHHVARDPEAVAVFADEIERISTDHGLGLYLAFGGVLGGWARAGLGETAAGLEQTRQWLERYHSIQIQMGAGYFQSILAETLACDGRYDEALSELDTAIKLSAKSGDRFWDAEILRLQGAYSLQNAKLDESAVEQKFLQALDVARTMNARSLELRAATSLASLWLGQSKSRQAHDLLAPIYGSFGEGFDTKDLGEARTLLGKLEAQ
jgi:class 3 adenylate cyclase/predicted ATPase